MTNIFNFAKANKETPNENGWCQMWVERGFGYKGLYISAFTAYQATKTKRSGTPPNDGNYYLVYLDGWFYGERYGDVALYRNGKVWSGSTVGYRKASGVSFTEYKKWLGTPQLCWSEYLGSKKIATIPTKKSIATLAKEVIDGKWGNGDDRKKRLKSAGYDYSKVQAEVNKLLSKPAKKSNDTIANEVLKGKWGNGVDRKLRLEKAGYNYQTIQKLVNKKLGY